MLASLIKHTQRCAKVRLLWKIDISVSLGKFQPKRNIQTMKYNETFNRRACSCSECFSQTSQLSLFCDCYLASLNGVYDEHQI